MKFGEFLESKTIPIIEASIYKSISSEVMKRINALEQSLSLNQEQ